MMVISFTEIGPRNRLDFLYDENGALYGLVKDSSKKYFYIRDFMSNILGLVDESGNIVVKYKYDAYGNRISITDTSGCNLSTRNPFRYKGYYYDDDTEMYYVNQDFMYLHGIDGYSISYLEPKNIISLNLFTYCNNNPVMYVDPSGNFTILGLLIGIGLSLVFEVIEDVLDGNGMDHDWRDYLGAGISGAFGALGGNVLMRVVFAIAGGLTDTWLSGDLEENGIGSVMVSIGIFFAIGEVTSLLSDYICNKIQINRLTSNPNLNKKRIE